MTLRLIFDMDFNVVDIMKVLVVFLFFMLWRVREVFDRILIPLIFLQREVETAYQSTYYDKREA